jgi:hypothetical protein
MTRASQGSSRRVQAAPRSATVRLRRKALRSHPLIMKVTISQVAGWRARALLLSPSRHCLHRARVARSSRRSSHTRTSPASNRTRSGWRQRPIRRPARCSRRGRASSSAEEGELPVGWRARARPRSHAFRRTHRNRPACAWDGMALVLGRQAVRPVKSPTISTINAATWRSQSSLLTRMPRPRRR